jgi:hypothetical protein
VPVSCVEFRFADVDVAEIGLSLAPASRGVTPIAVGGKDQSFIVEFSYSGRGGPDFAGLICTGTGSFSFTGDLSTVGLADLTSFGFTLEENTSNSATFGLADLTSFSAAVGPGPTLTSLAIATGWVQGTNQSTYPRGFNVSSLSPADASTSFEFLDLPFSLTSGTVAITSVTTTVPEPSALSVTAVGSLIVAAGWSRARKA